MNRISRFLILIPIVFLLLALTRMPYGYYSTMRIVVSWAALVFMINECVAAFEYKKWERFVLCALFLTGIMLLFNPLVPFGFPRQTWLMLNIGAATLFFVYFVLYDYGREAKTKDEIKLTTSQNTTQSDGVFNGRRDENNFNEKRDIKIITEVGDHSDLLREALRTAKSSVVIASPYLSQNAMDANTIDNRINLAVSRGVNVKVICNPSLGAKSSGGTPAFNNCVGYLKGAGAEVYESRIHSKFICVDSEWLVVGSFNWLSSVNNPSSIYAMKEASFYYSGQGAAEMISELRGKYGA